MRYLQFFSICFLILLFPLQFSAAQPNPNKGTITLNEEKIKAGMLYNFLKYTEWPNAKEEAKASLIVCVFGDDHFKNSLEPLQGRTVNQREILIQAVDSIEDTQICHLLFVTEDEKEHWPELAKFLAGKSVLTVSDLGAFTNSGGMIEFSKKGERIIVELNMEAVAAAKLRVQDRLLKLVTVVGTRR